VPFIDLNCDMGEIWESVTDGTQEGLMRSVSSVNIACGGHAGDEATMQATMEQAKRCNVAVGAHPGYPDPANFGRLEWNLPAEILADAVFEQLLRLAEVAGRCGIRIGHVKPHGALYNQAARDRTIAGAIALGVARWSTEVVLVGLAGSVGLEAWRKAGFSVAAEAFADRRYEADGSLRPRRFPDALIKEPGEAARQAVDLAGKDGVQTICIHSDTPSAAQIAAAVREALGAAKVTIRPFFAYPGAGQLHPLKY